MEKSESIKNIAIALCKFQAQVEKIKKEASNPFFKSKYATLANILDVIRIPLAENGLSFVQFPSGKNCLITMLMHESGEYLSDSYEMTPVKNDPQALGSAITYQRRYALGAVLGLNIDDDDDGNHASKPKKQEALKKELTPDMIGGEAFLKWISNQQGCANIIDFVRKSYFLPQSLEIELMDNFNRYKAKQNGTAV